MKKVFLVAITLLFSLSMSAQHFALKNNLLWDATTTPNLGMEIGLGKRVTLDIMGGYNPFEFKHDRQLKHWLVQSELRIWGCEKFNGTFFGIHAHGGQFDIAGVNLPFDMFPSLKHNRYDGYLYGGGISIGHQWILSNRWSIEATIGGGYARIEYDRYKPGDKHNKLDSGHYNFWGVTKAGISFIYFIH